MFGLKRQKGKVVLVADLDDATVGVAVVRLGERASILRSTRVSLPIEQRTKDHSVSAVAQLLAETVQKTAEAYAAEHGSPSIAGSYAVLRSPWTRFRTTQAEVTYEKPVAMMDSDIASLAKKALQNPSELDTANRLESGIVHVYLNGYPTNDPIGKHASSALVTVYESDVNPEMRRAVTDALAKALPGRTPILRSSMCALVGVVGQHLPEMHRSLLIDVGSTSTHCAVVLKEAVTQTAVVNEGLFTVIANVGGASLPEDILTQLRMLATDTCATDTCKALKDSLARLEPDLAKTFGDAFAKLATPRRLPNTAMLSAPAEIAPWLVGFFARIDFSQFTATMQPLSVEPLTADHLSHAVEWDGAASDTGLGIAAAYVNILANDSSV